MVDHVCSNAILHCIDFRFQEFLDRFIDEQGMGGDCDRISIAGGVKEFGEMFHELDLSEQLHHVKDMYLINHQDCGAYGEAVVSDPREQEIHASDLQRARELLVAKYPELRVHLYFLTLEGEFRKVLSV
jgi:carbonic anhydrase